jgi:hypothetical protein
MTHILEELFYGNLRPDENIHPNTPEYLELTRKISGMLDTYQKQLSADKFDTLEKLVDLLGESTSIYAASAFTQGFQIGARMMIEVVTARDKPAGINR